MKSPHILKAGNPRRIKEHLSQILDHKGVQAIENELRKNVRELYALGEGHFRFAARVRPGHWRQRVSRFYYAAYNVSRAIRLEVSGEHTTDGSDHKKVGDLPEGFPNNKNYKESLAILREDRNLCDYDHSATEDELALGQRKSHEVLRQLMKDARAYLTKRGVTI